MFTPNGFVVSSRIFWISHAHFIELAGRCFDDAHAARIRHGGGKLGAGDPAHRRLDDGIFHAQHLGDAVFDRL